MARLAFGLVYWVGKPLTHDEREYLSLARNLTAGAGFRISEADVIGDATTPPQQFGRAPLYPLFIAAVARPGAMPEDVPDALKIAQAGVGGLTVWIVGLLGIRLAGPRTGLAAGWLAALYPPLVWICGYALTEALYACLALAGVLVLWKALEGPARPWMLVSAGLLSGVAALARPGHLVFIVLAALLVGRRRGGRAAVGFALASSIAIAPWTIRSLQHHDRFVLIASEGGVTFWTGNNPLATGEGDMAANPAIKGANARLRRAHADLSPEALEDVYYREAFRYIAGHPLEWLWLIARKAYYFVVPTGPSYGLHSTRYHAATVISYLVAAVLAVGGVFRLGRRALRAAPALLLPATAGALALAFFPQERFRIPLVDPVLLLFAAACCAGTAPGFARPPAGSPRPDAREVRA